MVDHEERRREVTQIAARLIARQGVGAASVRAIAREAGCSTAVVSYYFKDKRELMLATYRQALEDTMRLARRRCRRGLPLAEVLEAFMPIERRRRDNWKVWLAFWGVAVADEPFMTEQQHRSREARALFAELIGEAIPIADAERRAAEARRLVVFISGLATQAAYDPAEWPAELQRALLHAELRALDLDPGRPEQPAQVPRAGSVARA